MLFWNAYRRIALCVSAVKHGRMERFHLLHGKQLGHVDCRREAAHQGIESGLEPSLHDDAALGVFAEAADV